MGFIDTIRGNLSVARGLSPSMRPALTDRDRRAKEVEKYGRILSPAERERAAADDAEFQSLVTQPEKRGAFPMYRGRKPRPQRDESMIEASVPPPKPVVDSGTRGPSDMIAKASGQPDPIKIDARRNTERLPGSDLAPMTAFEKEYLDAIRANTDPAKGRGDLSRAMLIAGLTMLGDDNESSWDAMSKGALAGVDTYYTSKDKDRADQEDARKRRIEGARAGYDVEGARRDRARQARADDRADEELALRRKSGESDAEYRRRMAKVAEQNADRPTAMKAIEDLVARANPDATPQEIAQKALDIAKPAANRVDPQAIAAAKAVLDDMSASPADKRKAQEFLRGLYGAGGSSDPMSIFDDFDLGD